jgi:hypothetical protein
MHINAVGLLLYWSCNAPLLVLHPPPIRSYRLLLVNHAQKHAGGCIRKRAEEARNRYAKERKKNAKERKKNAKGTQRAQKTANGPN